jgi:hypothetical protein
MPFGKILNVMSKRPAKMEGKSFKYMYNPKNKTYVKFAKVKRAR